MFPHSTRILWQCYCSVCIMTFHLFNYFKIFYLIVWLYIENIVFTLYLCIGRERFIYIYILYYKFYLLKRHLSYTHIPCLLMFAALKIYLCLTLQAVHNYMWMFLNKYIYINRTCLCFFEWTYWLKDWLQYTSANLPQVVFCKFSSAISWHSMVRCCDLWQTSHLSCCFALQVLLNVSTLLSYSCPTVYTL